MSLGLPYYFTLSEDWEGIPNWETIVADWSTQMAAANADVSVDDLPLVAPHLSWHSYLDSANGTWLPINTLSKMKAAHTSQLSLLRSGERFAFANPSPEFPYVPAGALDVAKILVDHDDSATFAAAMIAASSLLLPRNYYDRPTVIGQIAALAFAHLAAIAVDTRSLRGTNRKSWLPAHHISEIPENYEQAISLLVAEHSAVLSDFRPVRLVPYIQGPNGVVPAEQEEIEVATDEISRRVASASYPSHFGITARAKEAEDLDARPPFRGSAAQIARDKLALDFFNETISATGQNPARFARRPRLVHISTKAQGRTAFQITLWREEEPWEVIRDEDQASKDAWLEVIYNRDGSNSKAAKLIRDYVSVYEAALAESEEASRKGIDPAELRPGEVQISSFARHVLKLAGIEIGKNLTIKRHQYMNWRISVQLECLHPRNGSTSFSVKDGVLCFSNLHVPCATFGGITVSRDEHGALITLPRPLHLPDTGELNEHLKSSALEGLPGLLIDGSSESGSRTLIRIDPTSPALTD